MTCIIILVIIESGGDKVNIKELRKQKGWKQWELAKAVGVSVNTVVLWEHEVSQPTPENMQKLKEVLNVK